jgi:hypothetical protein
MAQAKWLPKIVNGSPKAKLYSVKSWHHFQYIAVANSSVAISSGVQTTCSELQGV